MKAYKVVLDYGNGSNDDDEVIADNLDQAWDLAEAYAQNECDWDGGGNDVHVSVTSKTDPEENKEGWTHIPHDIQVKCSECGCTDSAKTYSDLAYRGWRSVGKKTYCSVCFEYFDSTTDVDGDKISEMEN